MLDDDKLLLNSFIREKLASYVEPQRKGTPKGEPIGFTKKKYHAGLQMLTSCLQKDIAKYVGVSHSLLRTWNTESNFKALVFSLRSEFAIVFRDYILKRFKLQDAYIKELSKLPPKEVMVRPIYYAPYPELGDAIYYGKDLITSIWQEIFNSFSVRKQTVNLFFTAFGVFLEMNYLCNNAFLGEDKDGLILAEDVYSTPLRELACEYEPMVSEKERVILTKPSISKKDQVELIILRAMRNEMHWMG